MFLHNYVLSNFDHNYQIPFLLRILIVFWFYRQINIELEALIAQPLQAERGQASILYVIVYGNVWEKCILPGGELNPGLPRDRRGY